MVSFNGVVKSSGANTLQQVRFQIPPISQPPLDGKVQMMGMGETDCGPLDFKRWAQMRGDMVGC